MSEHHPTHHQAYRDWLKQRSKKVRVRITQDVDGMVAGTVHELRAGYADSLIRQGKAVGDAGETVTVESVSVPSEPIQETVSEVVDECETPLELDDEE
jgi:hypothetical protein